MTFTQAIKKLESLGTAQNRKVYARHGAGAGTFGVSFANLSHLKKAIHTDHALAVQLWRTGNFDARNLAVLIADPAQMTAKDLDAWVAGIDTYVHADGFVRHVVSRSPHARRCAEGWMGSKQDLVAQAGWDALSCLAMQDGELADGYFEKHLKTIEKNIHRAPNRTRHAMNGSLIAIGLRNEKLGHLALAVAANIGKVVVDHGETGCKTPDAAAYIRKAREHRKKKGR